MKDKISEEYNFELVKICKNLLEQVMEQNNLSETGKEQCRIKFENRYILKNDTKIEESETEKCKRYAREIVEQIIEKSIFS